jgi:hypothetical protein
MRDVWSMAYLKPTKRRIMDEKKLKSDIIEKIDVVTKALAKGKDVELRKTASGVSVTEVTKKVVAR